MSSQPITTTDRQSDGSAAADDDASSTRVQRIVDSLSLDEKALLTAGADVWHLPPIERLGIGALKMSDGPSGVRGAHMGTSRSLSFPCGSAVGATWDVELAERYGAALADEAQSKYVNLILGPTVCTVRMPLAGRTFESFTEDPHLAARLTVAYVRAVQAGGVGCCVKHFACNDQEHERMTISAEVDERALREIHLPAFEAAVCEAGAWAVMSAYNKLDGTYCGEHPRLLGEILKDEWGFDGVVVSDWFGTHSTVDATNAGLDIEMPGPPQHLGPKLAEAVEAGDVDLAVLDEHATRIVHLLDRCGMLDEGAEAAALPEAEDDDPERRRVAHELAVGSTVLVTNDGVLPLQTKGLRRIALIGPNATHLENGGGGSSVVAPHRHLAVDAELRERLGDVEIVHEVGCRIDRGLPLLQARLLDGGMRISYFVDNNLEGEPAATDTLRRGEYIALGDPAPNVPVRTFSLRATGTFTPDVSGTWKLGLTSTGQARVLLDGEVVIDNSEPERGVSFFGYGNEPVTTDIDLEAGRAHELVVELRANGTPIAGFQIAAGRPVIGDEIERAVTAAREADVAIVVAGTTRQWETEGEDRADLRLPGDQDELVRRVADANSNTIVVINAGAPVELPWIDAVRAALVVWFPGEEGAAALADVLTGLADPGGRLPVTFPKRLEDLPTHRWYPGSDGRVEYGEGVMVGYRHFDTNGIEPAFRFGHGLSYASFDFGEPVIDHDGDTITVTVPVTNTSARDGSEVVQLYVRPANISGDAARPDKELRAFSKVHLAAGATGVAKLVLNSRAFARWAETAHDWLVDAGDYELLIGTSSCDIQYRVPIAVDQIVGLSDADATMAVDSVIYDT